MNGLYAVHGPTGLVFIAPVIPINQINLVDPQLVQSSGEEIVEILATFDFTE